MRPVIRVYLYDEKGERFFGDRPLRLLPLSRRCRTSAAHSPGHSASLPSSHGLPLTGDSTRVSGLGNRADSPYSSAAQAAAAQKLGT